MKGLTLLKNIIWAFGILVCLVALIAGFVVGSFTKYSGPEVGELLDSMDEQLPQQSMGQLMSLSETADGGQLYLDSLTFLVDSSLIGLRDLGLLSGGTSTSQVWGSAAGNIPVSSIADPTIRYSDGSEKTVSQAAAAAKPSVLIISLGMDSLQKVSQAEFEANYTALVNNIRSASPNTKIVLCSLTSITSAYSGADGLTFELIKSAEEWIQNVCRSTGVYYADAGSAVKDTSGTLLSDYSGVNNKALNSAGISKVLDYLRSHTVP